MIFLNPDFSDNSNNSDSSFQPKTFINRPIYTASETDSESVDNSSNFNTEIDSFSEGDRPDRNDRDADSSRPIDSLRDSLGSRLFAYSS